MLTPPPVVQEGNSSKLEIINKNPQLSVSVPKAIKVGLNNPNIDEWPDVIQVLQIILEMIFLCFISIL
jgi:hypothetical protein